MSFYTNVQLVGDNLLYLGYENGQRIQRKFKFSPTLFVVTDRKTKHKTLDGRYAKPVKFDSIKEARAFAEKYKHIENLLKILKIFIMNNNCYGIIKQFQDSYFNKRYIATESQDYTAPDFVKVAKAYGIRAMRATKNNYKDVINLAMQETGSILVDVVIDREQKLIPKLEYGNPLEDMSPYQTDEEIKNNMLIKMIPRRDNTQGWVTLNK